MPYENTILTSLGAEVFRKFLSSPRFDKYLEFADGDLDVALRLYKKNLDISFAFQIPLHFCEIAIRNAIAETLAKEINDDWPWNDGFRASLKSDHRETLRRAAKNAKGKPTGKVVANMRFLFWEQMLAEKYSELWSREIHNAFPNLPTTKGSDELRRRLQSEIYKVRILRNKIAHHERIIENTREFNPTVDLYRIFRLVHWRSSAASEWLNLFERDGYFSAITEYKWSSKWISTHLQRDQKFRELYTLLAKPGYLRIEPGDTLSPL